MRRLILIPIMSLAALGGCASSSTPRYDTRFGDAVREARHAQTLNPNAGKAPAFVGLDGKAAQEAGDRYRESFKAPPPVVNVINIGGAVRGNASQ